MDDCFCNNQPAYKMFISEEMSVPVFKNGILN